MARFTLLGGAAILAASVALASATAGTPAPQPSGTSTQSQPGQAQSDAVVDAKMGMRRLWEDHIAYLRNFIISGLADLQDQGAVVDRLMKNQDDIGGAIKPYFGNDAGNKLASLLRDHIEIATDLIQASKGGDQGTLDDAQERWSANGKQIADFLSSTNPNWSQSDMEAMLQKHLNLTQQEITSRINKDWNGDIKAYDDGQSHILKFADALSDGMAQQVAGMTERRSVSPGPAGVSPKHRAKGRHHGY